MIFHAETLHDHPVVAPEPDPHRILLAFENGELTGGLPRLPPGTLSLEQLQETQPAEHVRAVIEADAIDPSDGGDDEQHRSHLASGAVCQPRDAEPLEPVHCRHD